ncbi:11393_t:CDS:2, partial [Funneliformis geosporum]
AKTIHSTGSTSPVFTARSYDVWNATTAKTIHSTGSASPVFSERDEKKSDAEKKNVQ